MKKHSKWPDLLPFSSPHYTDEDKAAFFTAMAPDPTPEAMACELERALSRQMGVPRSWVMVTNSCTSALTIIYHFFVREARRLGISEVVEAPVLTWPSSYACAPSYDLVDMGYDLKPKWSAEKRIRTWVDLWGVPSIPARDALESSPLRVLDAAQNLLDPVHARELRSETNPEGWWDAVAYSFGPVKQISTIRGGAIVSPRVTEEWLAFRDSGTIGRDAIYHCGGNYELAAPNAALGLCQLMRFKEMQLHRDTILGIYRESCSGTYSRIFGESGHLAVLASVGDFSLDRVKASLEEHHIRFGHHYPLPLHVPPLRFPEARAVSSHVLTLPCHCDMTLEDAQIVADILRKKAP